MTTFVCKKPKNVIFWKKYKWKCKTKISFCQAIWPHLFVKKQKNIIFLTKKYKWKCKTKLSFCQTIWPQLFVKKQKTLYFWKKYKWKCKTKLSFCQAIWPHLFVKNNSHQQQFHLKRIDWYHDVFTMVLKSLEKRGNLAW